MLYFESAGTRDGDRKYEGRFVPLESNHSEWNGIVEYSWDFGDASPISHEPKPWHYYDRSGTYTVTLTVRDSYLTGDVTRSSFTIVVTEGPEINEILIPEETVVGESIILDANVSDKEDEDDYVIWRDEDVFDGLHTDRDQRISSAITIKWDVDLNVDKDDNGFADDDWEESESSDGVRVKASWDKVGEKTVRLQVCDATICVTEDYVVNVLPKDTSPPSLSDFSIQDWQEWFVDASQESLLVIALIIAVLILGWAVMRSPTEIEEEAEQAAATYEVDEVESYGGVLGMDQHNPPPAPSILSKDERRNESSGYVRPLRRRP
tara:strand:- start:1524 stop:2486 length:963 start_codon:yes stop_codon:yes gene_type:complete